MRNFSILLIGSSIITGCSDQAAGTAGIIVDGSSTVFPISEAVAEEFRKTYSRDHWRIGYRWRNEEVLRW